MSGRRFCDFLYRPAPKSSGVATGRLYCVFRIFPGCRHLGLPLGSFPELGKGKRSESGQLLSLVHERCHLSHFPTHGSFLRSISVCVFFGDDGGAILGGFVFLSGDKRLIIGGDAKEAGAQLRLFLGWLTGAEFEIAKSEDRVGLENIPQGGGPRSFFWRLRQQWHRWPRLQLLLPLLHRTPSVCGFGIVCALHTSPAG